MPIEENDTTIRIQIDDPNKFDKDSYRTIDIEGQKGIKALIGKYRTGSDSMHVQTFLFNKKYWNMETAKQWISENQKNFKITKQDNVKMKEFKRLLKTVQEKQAEKRFTISNNEIIRAGRTIDGRRIKRNELKEIITNYEYYEDINFKIPLIFGHEDKEHEKLGNVENLRISKNSIYADFTGLTQDTYNKFMDGTYSGWSSELYSNVNDRKGNEFSGVSLLRLSVLSSSVPSQPFLKKGYKSYLLSNFNINESEIFLYNFYKEDNMDNLSRRDKKMLTRYKLELDKKELELQKVNEEIKNKESEISELKVAVEKFKLIKEDYESLKKVELKSKFDQIAEKLQIRAADKEEFYKIMGDKDLNEVEKFSKVSELLHEKETIEEQLTTTTETQPHIQTDNYKEYQLKEEEIKIYNKLKSENVVKNMAEFKKMYLENKFL